MVFAAWYAQKATGNPAYESGESPAEQQTDNEHLKRLFPMAKSRLPKLASGSLLALPRQTEAIGNALGVAGYLGAVGLTHIPMSAPKRFPAGPRRTSQARNVDTVCLEFG